MYLSDCHIFDLSNFSFLHFPYFLMTSHPMDIMYFFVLNTLSMLSLVGSGPDSQAKKLVGHLVVMYD